MVAVILHQPLSNRFGKHHEFEVRSPREAVAALDANYPGFLAAFMAHQHHWIIVDGEVRGGPTKDDGELAATMPAGKEIHFIPAVEGNAFIGPMIVGSILGIASTTLTAQILGTLLVVGVLTGLSLLFRKKVATSTDDKNAKLESYAFSGPENVTTQGATVPLVYGACYCGTVVVSAGLDLGTDTMPTIPPPPPAAAAQYPTNTTGLPADATPAAGWPPIVAQKVSIMSASSSHGQPSYSLVTKYGPSGYAYVGQTYVYTQQKVGGATINVKENVDYWRGPKILVGQIFYLVGASQNYAWDRINGFTVFSQSKVI